MKDSGINSAIRDLQTLLDEGVIGQLTDGQLLDRFLTRREAVVFEAIVHRHGSMVWSVCRRVLRDHHDAEDACQATFLVLSRKAASVMPREKVGNWLYGVAYQTSMKARATRAKRRSRESQVPKLPEPEAALEKQCDDLSPQLDRILSRLPEKYRVPIVLCELEGKTHKEAANQLGWPIGTVSGRLSRAKAILSRRLSQPGRVFSVDSLAILLSRDTTSTSIPIKLIESTVQTALSLPAGRVLTTGLASIEVASLTSEVLKMMLLKKLMSVTAVLALGIAFVASGTTFAYYGRGSEQGPGGATSDLPVSHQQAKVIESPRPAKRQEEVTRTVPASPPQATVIETPPPPGTFGVKPKAALPGNTQSNFGGGPDQPRYMRHDNLFFVISPIGDKFSIYDALTKKSAILRLPATKESPLHVTPIIGGGNFRGTPPLDPALMSVMIAGPKITRIHVFNFEDWKWYGQDLKEPAFGNAGPAMGWSVAAFAQGRYIHAFSTKTKRWSTLELPQGIKASPTTFLESIVVEHDGHIYEFSGDTGEWKHTDLRAIIDAALDSAKEEAN